MQKYVPRLVFSLFFITQLLQIAGPCFAQTDEFLAYDGYRAGLVDSIVAKWEGEDEATSSERWEDGIRVWLQRLNSDQLESALAAASYDELARIVSRAARPVAAVGNLDAPFATGKLYYPLDPCRLVDTRIADQEFTGPIPAGAVRSYNAMDSASIESQGGKTGGCGVPANASALVVNITSTAQAGKGHLRAYPYGTPMPLAAILSFSSYNISNATILPICSPSCAQHFSVYASNATYLVVDVMGYFAD